MDVFALRDHLAGDYASYIQSFINVQDPRIREFVDRELRAGLLWSDSLLQLNPCFEPGPGVDDLVAPGVLYRSCRQVFRMKSDSGAGQLTFGDLHATT